MGPFGGDLLKFCLCKVGSAPGHRLADTLRARVLRSGLHRQAWGVPRQAHASALLNAPQQVTRPQRRRKRRCCSSSFEFRVSTRSESPPGLTGQSPRTLGICTPSHCVLASEPVHADKGPLHCLAHSARHSGSAVEIVGDQARVRSKGLAVMSNGGAGSAVYNDALRRTDQGW